MKCSTAKTPTNVPMATKNVAPILMIPLARRPPHWGFFSRSKIACGSALKKAANHTKAMRSRRTITSNVEVRGDAPLYGAASLSTAGLAGTEDDK